MQSLDKQQKTLLILRNWGESVFLIKPGSYNGNPRFVTEQLFVAKLLIGKTFTPRERALFLKETFKKEKRLKEETWDFKIKIALDPETFLEITNRPVYKKVFRIFKLMAIELDAGKTLEECWKVIEDNKIIKKTVEGKIKSVGSLRRWEIDFIKTFYNVQLKLIEKLKLLNERRLL